MNLFLILLLLKEELRGLFKSLSAGTEGIMHGPASNLEMCGTVFQCMSALAISRSV